MDVKEKKKSSLACTDSVAWIGEGSFLLWSTKLIRCCAAYFWCNLVLQDTVLALPFKVLARKKTPTFFLKLLSKGTTAQYCHLTLRRSQAVDRLLLAGVAKASERWIVVLTFLSSIVFGFFILQMQSSAAVLSIHSTLSFRANHTLLR